MLSLLEQFRELPRNRKLCKKLIRNHQEEYLRKRLKFIQLLWSNKTEVSAYTKVNMCKTTANKCLHIIVSLGVDEGLKKLAKNKKVKKDFKLSDEQSKEIILMVETQSPKDYGYDKNIFTGKVILEVIMEKYGIKVSPDLVYDLLHRHGFTYHKAHRDYLEANKNKQSVYQETLKKNWKIKKIMKQ